MIPYPYTANNDAQIDATKESCRRQEQRHREEIPQILKSQLNVATPERLQLMGMIGVMIFDLLSDDAAHSDEDIDAMVTALAMRTRNQGTDKAVRYVMDRINEALILCCMPENYDKNVDCIIAGLILSEPDGQIRETMHDVSHLNEDSIVSQINLSKSDIRNGSARDRLIAELGEKEGEALFDQLCETLEERDAEDIAGDLSEKKLH